METEQYTEDMGVLGLALGNFLSGMETRSCFGRLRKGRALETSLVEWKRTSPDAMSDSASSLETSLVEWKPVPFAPFQEAQRSLETSLVEWKLIAVVLAAGAISPWKLP